MRRKDREIFEQEIEKILEQGEYGVLSTVGPDHQPYGVPMSYTWKNGLIHLHCAKGAGKKLENIRFCSQVTFTVVGKVERVPQDFTTRYESVILSGEIAPSENKAESLMALVEKYAGDYLEEGAAYIQKEADTTGVYVIRPQEITGKAKR